MPASTFRPATASAPALDHAAIRREISARFGAVLSSPEGKAQPALAQHLLAESDLTAEQITAALAVAGTQAAGQPATARSAAALDFISYMATVPNPQVGADNTGDNDPEIEEIVRRARLRDGRG